MKSPWVITPKGKLESRAFYDQNSFHNDLKDLFRSIENWKIKETRLIMNQSEWDDIMKYSQGSEE